jgi:protein-L-isoaspartate(D-aspartate) O-methyltransferase
LNLHAHRRAYADLIASTAGVNTRGLADAFAAVPREAFLPPGPWLVVGERAAPRQTPGADPQFVYENVSVAIDAERQLFNGAPAFVARMIDVLNLRPSARALHVGAGLGYYSAIIGYTVCATGAVAAIEVDEALAAQAQANLAGMPWVTVTCADATAVAGPFDAILVHAGVTHPQEAWLDALAPSGRLVLPLTVAMPGMGPSLGKGVLALIERSADGATYRAEVLSFVAIYSAVGLRDEEIASRLGQAMRRTSFPALTHLRRDSHESSPDCWLHGGRFCLSMA